MKSHGFLRLSFLLLGSVLVGSLLAGSSLGQNNSSDALISGTIVDATGGAIGGVAVTAVAEGHPATIAGMAISKADGSYSLAISAGRYHLRFVRSPFVSLERVVEVRTGEKQVLNSQLVLERLSASVIVTAEVEPTLLDQATAPVSIIPREEIEARQSVSVADALLFTPGVAIARTGAQGGTASIFLNGGNSNFTKVLVDGTPINPPGSAVDFSGLTLDNIDKVEIVRGAESAIYGTDAVSGVIQLFTHRGETRIPETSMFAEGGSFSSARGGGDFGGMLGGFDYAGAAAYFQTDGQGPNDRFINRTLSGNFGYRFSDSNQIRLTIRNNTSNAGIPGQTLLEPPSRFQHYDQSVFSANARWNFSTGRHWRHEISGGESYTRQHNDNPTQSFYLEGPNSYCPQANPGSVATSQFCDFTGESRFKYNRANVTAQTSYALSNFGVTAGYEYEVENAFLTSVNANHARRNNQGGFLDFRYRPVRRIMLNFGERAEANANFGTRVVPRVGAAVVLHSSAGIIGDTLLRGFYGQGIKEPRFDQILGDNFGDLGNPLLKPESSRNWTAGVEQKLLNDRLRLSTEYFYTSFYNLVSFAFLPSGTGFFFNTDRALARGINVTGQTKFNRWLTLAGNYTYSDTRVLQAPNAFDPTEQPGNHLLRRPVNSGSLTLNAAYRRFGFTVGVYVSGIRTDSDFLGLSLARTPGYARFDVATHYDFGHGLRIYARAQNILDKQYQDALGYPALGRDARAGIRYTFKIKH
jgi:vitamin B12 transporter